MDETQLPTLENISRLLHVVEALWPTVLAGVALLTFINRMVQRLPDRFARVKNIVAPLTVDLVEVIAEVGGALRIGPRKPEPVGDGIKKRISFPPDGPGPTAGAALVGILAFLLVSVSVFLGGATGCQPGQAPKAPTFDLIDTVSRQVGNILAFVEPLLPPGDVKLAALKSAQAQKDFERFFALARPVLEEIAKSGEEVPQDVADQVVTGEAAAESVQNFARAISGRNQDGSPKDGGS